MRQGETGDASVRAQDFGPGLGAVILRGTNIGGPWCGKEGLVALGILKGLDDRLASRSPKE